MGARGRVGRGGRRHRAGSDTPLTELLLDAVGPRTGLGSALNDAVREVGGVVGVAVLGSVAVTVAGPAATGSALLEGVRAAAAVAATLLAIASAVTARSSVLASDTPAGAIGASARIGTNTALTMASRRRQTRRMAAPGTDR